MHVFTWFSIVPFLKKYATEEYIHVVTAAFITLLCIVLALIMSSKLKKIQNPEIPDAKFSFRNFFELISGMLFSLASEIMGEKNAQKFFPVLASVFLFIFLNDIIG